MSGNVRFIWNNSAGNSAASATYPQATSSSGTLLPANMQLDERAAVWRSTSLAAQTLDYRWTADQIIDSICLAWTNLSSGATVQLQGFTTIGGVKVFDQTFSPDTALSIGNTTVQGWLTGGPYTVRQVKIIITDAANTDGYVQVSRAVIGKRIEPVNNADQQGFSIGFSEQAKPVRAESRDLRIEPLGRFRRLTFVLARLELASRDLIIAMIANGLGRGVWVSVFPESTDGSTRQLHAFWGALVSEVDLTYPVMDKWSAPIVIEEMG